jgi:hypothetical protein
VLWRGVGEDVDETLFTWEAPDGTRLFTVYLMQGYGNAMQLPLEPEALAQRLEAAAGGLAPRSRIPSLLLMNGSDHQEPQPRLPAALAAAAQHLRDETVEIGTLPGFAERARREAHEAGLLGAGELPLHRGELRSGLRAPLLAGCASTRLAQKRADFLNERLLVHHLEPLATWLAALGGDGDPAFLDLAWEIALRNHPHDSICGCSVDAVHEQMETRFARVAQIAGTHLSRVTRDLGRRVALPGRGFGRGAGEGIVVWNPHDGGCAQAEGIVELDLPGAPRRAPALHLRDASGRRIPAHVEIVEPGSVFADYRLPAPVVATLVRGFPEDFMGLFVCAVSRRRAGGVLGVDLLLGSERPTGFDLDAAKRELCAALEAEGDREVVYRARRLPRVCVRFVDALPGYGLRVYRVARGRAGREGSLGAERRADDGAAIWNAAWRVEVSADGIVRCEDRRTGAVVEDAVRLVSEGDRGDTYTFDPVPGSEVVERPAKVRVRLLPASEAEVGIVVDARYRIPAALEPGRASRSRRRVALEARLALRLCEGLDRVDLDVQVDNGARDHRLRAHVRAPFAARCFEVESAFEVAERPIAPEPGDFGSDRPAEYPVGATPQRRYATLRGETLALSVANRGSPEVEAVREADGSTSLAVTLLRAVGWLSRDDLAMRPGHAGPPLPTPGAQAPGRQRAELSWRVHADADASRTPEALRFAVPALLFAGGVPQGPLGDGSRLLEVDDPAVAVCALEPRDGGGATLRLLNDSGRAREAGVRWTGPGARTLEPVDLGGRPLGPGAPAPDRDGWIRLSLRPWQLYCLRVV